jgi:hypothetical protein
MPWNHWPFSRGIRNPWIGFTEGEKKVNKWTGVEQREMMRSNGIFV